MIVEVLLGLVIVVAVVMMVVLLFFLKRPYRWSKEIKGDTSVFTFDARKDIKKIELSGKYGKEQIRLERKNIKKGEKIEFDYPASAEKFTLIVETESGRKKHEV